MELNDSELLARCIRRDKKAWDVFVERFSGLVYWSVRRALKSAGLGSREDLCSDIFQDVFRKMLEEAHLENIKEPKAIRKYLSLTSCHLVWDAAKLLDTRASREITLDLEIDPDKESIADDPGQNAAHRERDEAIEEVLGSLTPRERECVERHFMEGRSHRETGEILGIPVDTVSTILRRVRDKIKFKFERKNLREYL